MPAFRIHLLTVITMLAFAGNSVLCRFALKHTSIDAASFTSIRLISGAIVLWIIASFFNHRDRGNQDSPSKSQTKGNWISAFALFTYAAGFSFAYISLPAATGALLLFGAVQATMIGHGLIHGEQLQKQQLAGLSLAIGGLVGLLLPGLSAPPLAGSILMIIAGMAWGTYSLRGKNATNPTNVSAGNFMRATLFTGLLSLSFISNINIDTAGVWYAIASGAAASGLGYALWYSVLPSLKSTNAATIQLSVPVITALGGISILGEPITLRFTLASLAILGGIALMLMVKSTKQKSIS